MESLDGMCNMVYVTNFENNMCGGTRTTPSDATYRGGKARNENLYFLSMIDLMR